MRIAIVGAGVSGLVTAHLLHRTHDITVFEAGAYAGGHTNTVAVETEAGVHHVDTGFIVFNDRNYPRFERLLAAPRRRLAAVEHDLLGQRRARRLRVQRLARRTACSPSARTSSRRGSTAWSPTWCASTARPAALLASREDPSLRGWLEDRGYSRAFVERLIVPQAAAVWSADPEQMWRFPARFLAEFFDNHGMLGFAGRPRWRTVARRLAPLRRDS